MKKEMQRTVAGITVLFVLLLGVFTFFLWKNSKEAGAQNQLVLLNEIRQLTSDDNGDNPAEQEIALLQGQLEQSSVTRQSTYMIKIAGAYLCFTLVYLAAILIYLYVKILRPFYKLEQYASRIAKGDLDVPLEYERTNFFGAFTWAFDHMRRELDRARRNEAKAIDENKTIIATLSHDIKTPIASIRAYAEGLEASLDASYEQRERYLAVIMRKCDEVTRLTNDLMLHSLSELERLEILQEKADIKALLEKTIRDLEYPQVVLQEPVPEAELFFDEKRMAQVLENLLNNARKYAPDMEILVWAQRNDAEQQYEIHVRDHGHGILPEDLPFICDKFYRGKNAGDQPGSGLGLYIVSYIMERMHGGIALENHADGLEVTVWLPLLTS